MAYFVKLKIPVECWVSSIHTCNICNIVREIESGFLSFRCLIRLQQKSDLKANFVSGVEVQINQRIGVSWEEGYRVVRAITWIPAVY